MLLGEGSLCRVSCQDHVEPGIRESGHTGRMAEAMHHAGDALITPPLIPPRGRGGGVDFSPKQARSPCRTPANLSVDQTN